MRTTSATILSNAKRVAVEMLDDEQFIHAVPFGNTEDCLFVSTRPDLINWTDTFTINNKSVYLGTRKKVLNN